VDKIEGSSIVRSKGTVRLGKTIKNDLDFNDFLLDMIYDLAFCAI
jgi:hypothetical protein